MGTVRRHGWVLSAAVLSLVLTVQPFRDTDVWWHLALGRQIIAHGIPAVEPFSFVHAANPWVGQQWLYEVVLAHIVDIGGAGLASLVMGAVASAALLVAALSLPPDRRPGGPWMAAALLVGAAVAAQLLGVRGQVISLFGAAVVLYVVMRWRRGSTRWLLVLPPLFLVWANLHAGFIVGLAIGLVALLLARDVDRSARVRLAAALLAALLATLVNPAGPGLWGYIATTFTSPTLTGVVAEWQSPDFHNLWLRLFEAAALLLAACWFLAPRRDPVDLTLGALAIAAALQAQRNVALVALVAVPQLAGYGAAAWATQRHRLSGAGGRLPRGARPAPPWFAPLVALVLVGATAVALAPRVGAAAAMEYEATHLPMAPATYVATHLAGQRIYSPDTWSGYLAERFPTGRVVGVYDETAVFGDAALQQYLDVHDVRASWPAVIGANRIRVAILPANAQEVSALLTIGWTVRCHDAVSQSVVMSEPAAGTPAPSSANAAEIEAAPACV